MIDRLKILVVDDSAFMRLLISDLLSEDKSLEVIDTAVNGLEATEKVIKLSPDIVLLDLNMADYDGLYAVKSIMSKKPTPILILSSVGNTNLQPVFDALKNGAVDYINKPNRNQSKMRELQRELVQKIKSTSRAKPRKIAVPKHTPAVATKKKRKKEYDLIAIGASTGGPSAVERVICSLPADFDIPVVVCQHMPASFIPQYVQRLDSMARLNVVSATDKMQPMPGLVIFCPGHANLILKQKGKDKVKIDFTEEVFPDYNNPSINAMMLSAASIYGEKMIGMLLTGMGKDGVKGMKAIHDAGGLTIAQNKESSVIYGMPKAAYESGAIVQVLDIKDMGSYLLNEL